jgi:hypothetical protein
MLASAASTFVANLKANILTVGSAQTKFSCCDAAQRQCAHFTSLWAVAEVQVIGCRCLLPIWQGMSGFRERLKRMYHTGHILCTRDFLISQESFLVMVIVEPCLRSRLGGG